MFSCTLRARWCSKLGFSCKVESPTTPPPAIFKELGISTQSHVDLPTENRHIVEPLIHTDQGFTRVVFLGAQDIEFFLGFQHSSAPTFPARVKVLFAFLE